MKKTGILFAVVGSLIGIGIILSFYGNYVVFEELVKGDGEISSGEELIIEIQIDKTNTQSGIYAVQIIDFKGQTVSANVLDPFNSIIESQSINEEVFEGYFEVTDSGTYKLMIENRGEAVTIFGVIGPEPDEGKKSLTFISLYILVAGLFGMAGLAAYLVISRKRAAS
ncbi:MAG: hypothetical protein GTN35_01460 [Nitrososphaeria archaeon]|nr:hypothetical protein [Nitrosopumilaceae archaeon]NIP10096.1 hypothetical protein [Nitrosopumilaceae archaeon]NIP91073.1 hypothetical protein [Nitrososphaeria archaeon]NIS94892.1 hypothetical protein [Nitrosopumilaceae archaeon]